MFSWPLCSAPLCCFQTYKHLERKGVPDIVLSSLLSCLEYWTHKSQPSWKLSDIFKQFFFPLFSYSQRNVWSDTASQLVCNSLVFFYFPTIFSSVQSLSHVRLSVTPWVAACQASLSITNSQSLLKLIHWFSDAIQPSHPLSSPSPLAFSLAHHQGLFKWVKTLCIRWPKYWSFSISPSNEYPGLISFGMNWLDLLAVQGTLKNLLQHQSSKASILRCSAFFIVQLSNPYMTTGKTTASTKWAFVGKVMSAFWYVV